MTDKKRTGRNEVQKYFHDSLLLETNDCILWKYNKNTKGYGHLKYNGKRTRVPRLVLTLKVGPAPVGKNYALHSCHNPQCFNYRHLRWGTSSENMADKIKDDTSNYGERHGMCKLKTEQVLSIAKDTRLQGIIANEYGVSAVAIGYIQSGRTWSRITNIKYHSKVRH